MKILNYDEFPEQETWDVCKYSSFWAIDETKASMSTLNYKERYLFLIEHTLSSFKDWVQVIRISIIGYYEETDSFEVYSIDDFANQDVMQFLTDKVNRFEYDIFDIKLQVALWVFIKDEKGNVCKERQWLELGDYFVFSAGKTSEEPYTYLSLNHSLFIQDHDTLDFNTSLFKKNKNYLKRSLKKWEKCLGNISDTQGYYGVYKYGYKKTYTLWHKIKRRVVGHY